MGAESKTDFGDLDVDLTAKSSVDSPHVANSGLADVDGFGSRTALTSDRHVADHLDDDENINNVVDNAQLWLLAKRPRSASAGRGSVTYPASKLQVVIEITQGSTSYVDLDATKELEGEGLDVSVEGNDKDDDDTLSAKILKLSAVSDKQPAFNSNISRLQDDQPD